MKIPSVNYPIAMIVIIIMAVFVMYGGFIKPQQVNLAKYQELCTQYLQAPAGAYKPDQMQLLVEKINYLFPAPAKDLSQPVERELKTCSDQLTEKLKSARK